MIRLEHGFSDADRPKVAALFWEAFGGKLAPLLGSSAIPYLAEVMQPRFAFVAREGDTLIGLAGIKTQEGGLIGGRFADTWRHMGPSALWRAPMFDLFGHPVPPGVLHLDGLCVTADARGRGIGSALLDMVEDHARETCKSSVRLDVVEGNDAARRLYARRGYIVTGQVRYGPLGWLTGTRGATTMVKALPPR